MLVRWFSPPQSSPHRRGGQALLALTAACALLGASAEGSKREGDAAEEKVEPTTGSITGTVKFKGEELEGERIDMPRALRSMCGVYKRPAPYDLGKGGVLQNVVVSVIDAPAAPASDRQIVTLAMRRCEWSPRVASATVGQVLDIHNRDDALLRPVLRWQGHGDSANHVYRTQRMWIPKQGQHAASRLGGAGTLLISCEDVRPWAQAAVRVFEHPFHAVTDDKGNFEIAGLPPGSYHLVAWDRLLGEVTAAASVVVGKSSSVAILFDPARQTEEEVEPEPEPEPEPEKKPEAKPEKKPEAKPEKKPEAKPEKKPEAKPEKKPEAKPEKKPEASAG